MIPLFLFFKIKTLMKQFLTLCMAIAMSASAHSAGVMTTHEEGIRLQGEDTANVEVIKTRDRSSIKTFGRKLMKKVPSRVTPYGDNIFGYLGFYDGPDDLPVGYYELQEEGDGKLLWRDPYLKETGLGFNNAVKIDNRIAGYIQDIFGKLFGVYYLEMDAETGEILTVNEQDLEFNQDYISVFAYNPEDEKFYGYGYVDGTLCFMSAPIWEPFNYTMIKKLSGKEMCISMCYNPEEKEIIGINLNYQLVKIGTNGRQKVIMDLDVRNGDKYVTGMVYNPKSEVYYWNINYTNGLSAMATIDAKNKKLDIYEKYSYCVEYYNLMTTDEYISDPKEPLRPQAGAPVFTDGALTGYVPFTLPVTTADGKDLSGDVIYMTYLNGETYDMGKVTISNETDKEGNRVPTVFNAGYSVPEPGKYSFSMTVTSNGIESQKGATYKWIGNDIPENPNNVRFSKFMPLDGSEEWKPGSYIVSWDPVTKGVNNGYIDTGKMTYKIKVNGEEYTSTSAHLAVSLPTDIDLEAYKAEVMAVCNGLESKWVSSNTVTEGLSLTLPAYIVPTPDQYKVSLVLDNNNDERTWSLKESTDTDNPYYIQSNFSTKKTEQMDDWYFLPRMKFENTEAIHSFSMEIGLSGALFPNEFAEVLLCKEPSTDAVVDTIVKKFKPSGINYEKAKGLFRVPEAGDYYIAVHCISEGLQLGVKARNFEIEESDASNDTPSPAENIKVTPGKEGALKAVISFDMPKKNIADQDFDPATTLEATVSSPVESKTIKGVPGQKMSLDIEAEQGVNIFTVQICNGEQKSIVAKAEAYIGVHIPATPQLTNVTFTPDMLSMTIDWEPVSIGDDGEGYVNPATVVYDIYKLDVDNNRWSLYESGVTENTYTFVKEPGSNQEIIILGVLSRNEAGDNGDAVMAMTILGTPYELPIFEDYDKGQIYTDPWLTTYPTGEGAWGLFNNNDVTDDKSDRGISMVGRGRNGTVSRLATPRFSTKDLENASMTLELLKTNIPNVRILAEKYGEDAEQIGEIEAKELTERKETYTFSIPEEYLDKDWIGLTIEAEFDDDDQILVIESISIQGTSNAVSSINEDNDITITSGEGLIKVSGLNGGSVTITNTNGMTVGRQTKANEALFHLDKGIYIVTSGSRKAKVAVR